MEPAWVIALKAHGISLSVSQNVKLSVALATFNTPREIFENISIFDSIRVLEP